ncbi:MAG: GSCFA domain-containing protein [Chitinophagaceae bacterium]|nr:MAG: GSCFA domain-containing protein [Chitinophagaceae bacterium]
MNFQLSFKPEKFADLIRHDQRIMLMGSCFTENIGKRLAALKFRTLANPNGIIYDPVSITNSVVSYIGEKIYQPSDLILLNDLWQSWQHHGSFSGSNATIVLEQINTSQKNAHEFLKSADWVLITLGSAFSYSLAETGDSVANCHKAQAKTFNKHLLSIEDIKSSLDTCIHRLFHFNPSLRIIFTVSPVRYIRDGLVENNLSKSRLIEVVQHLVKKFSQLYYFPAYELVIDVLRDYRFYKEDMVHPTDQAIDYVFDNFSSSCFDDPTMMLIEDIKKINSALNHRPLHPDTPAYQQFRQDLMSKINSLQSKHPHLNFPPAP